MTTLTLDQLLGAAGMQEPTMAHDQMVKTLRNVREARAEVVKLEPGAILRHKFPSVAAIRSAKVPHMFVRWVEPFGGQDFIREPTEIGQASACLSVDCVVATICDGYYHEHFSDSRDWELHPDFPTLTN